MEHVFDTLKKLIIDGSEADNLLMLSLTPQAGPQL
jgi:hypothetical protein